ncbi:MAG: hypothetical protein K8Q89_01005 [Nitrosarchaeum sp.]|nr:hypothetical protein [Nitrosarchaeum sp.]
MKTCSYCGIVFEDDNEKFCSQICKDAYLAGLTKRIQEAVKNDHGHTENMTKNS